MFLTNSKKIEALKETIKDNNATIYYLNSIIDKYFIELNNTRHELYEIKRKYNKLKEKNEKLKFQYNRTTTKAIKEDKKC